MKVKNKQFVVTGAGGGIGGALVLALLKKGAKVVAVDVRIDNFKNSFLIGSPIKFDSTVTMLPLALKNCANSRVTI